MLKKISYLIPILFTVLLCEAQSGSQTTTFSGVTGFSDDGFGNYTNTASAGWGNNMLTSANFIAAGEDGSVKYVVVNKPDKIAFGLSNSQGTELNDITYRIQLEGKLYVWEGNTLDGNYGGIAVGDVLEVVREGYDIGFIKNGVRITTITSTSTPKLYLKVSVKTSPFVIPNTAFVGDYYEPMEYLSETIGTSCFENSDEGAINLTVTKGVAPYTYSWSNTATTKDIANLIAGDYTVTVTDATGAQLVATLTVMQKVVWNYCEGQTEGKSLYFDGADDYAKTTEPVLDDIGAGNFTFEAWVKGDESMEHPIIFSNTSAEDGAQFFFHDADEGYLYKMLTVQLEGVNYFVSDNGTFNAAILDGTDHHVAITRAGIVLTFYVDGVSIGTREIEGSPTMSTGAELILGMNAADQYPFKGDISDVRIWDVARTAADLLANKAVLLTGTETGLIANWQMKEGEGQAAKDKTTNAYDAYLGSSLSNEDDDPSWITIPALQITYPCVPGLGIALSSNELEPNTDGQLIYVIDQEEITKLIGLTDVTTASGNALVDYAIQLNSDGNIYVYESGVQIETSHGAYALNQELKIERVGSEIRYYVNNILLKTTTTDPTKTLIVKTHLTDVTATFNDVLADFCNQPFFVIEGEDASETFSYTVTGAGINQTFTSGTNQTLLPVFPRGENATIQITTTRQDGDIVKVFIEVDEELNVISSSVKVLADDKVRTYGVDDYLIKKTGKWADLSFNMVSLNDNALYHSISLCDNDKNWTSSRFFDENGNLVNDGKSFFNHLGNPTQTQSKNLTENTVMASEKVYDAYGRGVLSTLPAPIYSSSLCFKNDFIKSSLVGGYGGVTYDYTQFDVPNYTMSNSVIVLGEVDKPRGVENTNKGTLGWYYSNNNDEEPYVATTEYPYSRIEYDVNNPGAVKRSSAPHNSLKMGSGHEAKSFSMPASGELNYVFGYANGWIVNEDFGPIPNDPNGAWEINNTDLRTNYQVMKTISVDADGNEVVTFVDNAGKTIAQCMSGLGDDLTNQNEYNVVSSIGTNKWETRYVDIHLPEGVESSLVLENDANEVTYQILDLDKNKLVDFGGSNDFTGTHPNLAPGYYRIIHKPGSSFNNILTCTYNLNYYNFTLYYFDKADRLVAVVPPKGVDDAYDPNLSITTVSTHDDFVENAIDYGLGTVGTKHVNFPITPTSNGNKQFSSILFYIDDGSSFGGTIVDINNQLTQAEAISGNKSYGSVIETSELTVIEPPGGFPCPCQNVPGETCIEALSAYAAGHNYPCGTATTKIMPTYIPAQLDAYGQQLFYYCVSCVGPAQYYRKYEITVDVIANDNTNVKIAEDRIFYAEVTGNTWSFSSSTSWNGVNGSNIPGANMCALGVDRSVLATNLKFEITNIKESKYVYNSQYNIYNLVEIVPAVYDDLADLKLNIKVAKHTFTGGSPNHTMLSTSQYNSVGELLKTHAPDAGDADFVYSKEGLLRFSRNDKQKDENTFSYTNYDDLGRPIESGEYDEDIVSTGPQSVYFQNVYNDYVTGTGLPVTDPAVVDDLNYQALVTAGKTIDITYSEYDFPDPTFPLNGYSQNVNIGDVSKTWTKPTETAATIPFTTWYSYNVQGRLEWMVQDIETIGMKTIDYVYNNRGDLIEVIYQKNNLLGEYFAHQYTYDQDKRLINVKTREGSTNSWDQQAHYEYYQHGPLKRTELGNGLQGIDYLYTTLGQLKAINSPNIGLASGNKFIDPGQDGVLNNFATDVFGMSIDYFKGDYVRSGKFVSSGHGIDQMYNGNIRAVRWNTSGLPIASSDDSWMYKYEYNKKQWLKSATFGTYSSNPCDDPSSECDQNSPETSNYFSADQNDAYKVSNLTYDLNGNILTLNRNAYGTNILMDQFTYNYPGNSNKLDFISDGIIATTPYNDLKNGQSGGNYDYDDIGQLVHNDEEDQHFTYNVSGLVTHVHQDAAKSIPIAEYFYDDKGFRYKKAQYDATGANVDAFTYYIRDAAGAIQHVYTDNVGGTASNEYPLYASSRIGNYYEGGDYVYELTDHLGNVRATIKDLNIQSQSKYFADFNGSLNGWGSSIPAPTVNISNTTNLSIVMNAAGMSNVGGSVNSPAISLNEGKNYKISISSNLLYGVVSVEVKNNGSLVTSQNITTGMGIQNVNFYLNGSGVGSVEVIIRSFTDMSITINDVDISQVDHNVDVLGYADYYPFGEKLPARNFTSSLLYKYAYQGQEHDEETGLEAFELRLWDGRIGRWLSTDPYNQFHSPYLGMGNNPIIGIDPDGGYCETCPQTNEYSGYIASNDYYSFDDGITYLSYLDGGGVTAFSDNFISNLAFSPNIGPSNFSQKGIGGEGSHSSFDGGIWDSQIIRSYTGDAISVSMDFTAAVGKGENYKVEKILILHGPDRFKFRNQFTDSKVNGVDLSLGLSLNRYVYEHNSANSFNKHSFNGFGGQYDAGLGFVDVGVSGARDRFGVMVHGESVGASIGSPLGFTFGSTYSFKLNME